MTSRGRSESVLILPSVNKAAHSDFETQRKRHPESIQGPPKRICVCFFKITNINATTIVRRYRERRNAVCYEDSTQVFLNNIISAVMRCRQQRREAAAASKVSMHNSQSD